MSDLPKYQGIQKIDPADTLKFLVDSILPAIEAISGGGGGSSATSANQLTEIARLEQAITEIQTGNAFQATGANQITINDSLSAILDKIIAAPSTETTLAAVLAKLSADPATQTTLAAVLAKLDEIKLLTGFKSNYIQQQITGTGQTFNVIDCSGYRRVSLLFAWAGLSGASETIIVNSRNDIAGGAGGTIFRPMILVDETGQQTSQFITGGTVSGGMSLEGDVKSKYIYITGSPSAATRSINMHCYLTN